MGKALITLGFIFFAVEILIAGIYGLTFIPWSKLAFLLSEMSLKVIFVILWNVAGALFLYLGYRE